ncbi:hypothetical protein OAC77_01795 [Reinekea forsetii]|nr:hypothetical protein [Reinekea forsetii]
MSSRYLTTLTVLMASIGVLLGCAQPAGSDTSGTTDGTADATIYRQIAGTSALGRAGSWSSNCLGSDLASECARADSEGNYLLSTPAEQSQLMWSDIPESDGTSVRLYSRYRHQDGLTSALININPSTHAVLDIWSNSQQGQSLELCAEEATCIDALLAGFSAAVEQTIVAQLDELLGEAWPDGRDPFDDVYLADPDLDELDLMHDTLGFVVSSSDLSVIDNAGEILTQVSLGRLLQAVELADLTLTSAQISAAQALPIPDSEIIVISLRMSVSPTLATEAPVDVLVSDRGSSSVAGGELTFSHDLTLANGASLSFSGADVVTTITAGGDHNWVVTATDINDFSITQGYVISVLNGSDGVATFGGAGSCLTPLTGLTANALNQCHEVQNGTALGSCDQLDSGSISLSDSPAPCAREVQNEGALFGVCTWVDSELRVFHYENPLRLNLVELFSEHQSRVATECISAAGNLWSVTP